MWRSAVRRPAGRFPTAKPPADLDWDMWVGPAQAADYSNERRKDFRWFFDYSGGKMTDWGAHHIDIAQWALGHGNSGPVKVSGKGKFTPIVPEKFDWIAYLDGREKLPNGFHTVTEFNIQLEYADGSMIHLSTPLSPRGRQHRLSQRHSVRGRRGPHLRQPRAAHRQAGRRH